MTFASLRATGSNFSSAISTVSVCGCLIRSAGNGRPSSCLGPLSLLLRMFTCGRQKDEDDFREAEAVAIFPLELMPCKLLSLGKLFFLPSVGHCLPSGSSFWCSMFYCPHGILGTRDMLPWLFCPRAFGAGPPSLPDRSQ